MVTDCSIKQMLPLIQLYSVLCIIVGDHRSPVNACKVCVCMVDATIVTVHVSLLEEPGAVCLQPQAPVMRLSCVMHVMSVIRLSCVEEFLLRMTAMSGP